MGKKLVLILLLAAMTIAPFTGITYAEGVPEYLNTESAWPIVKEGHDVTLSFGFQTDATYAKAETSLYFSVVENLLNISAELIPIDASAMEQRLNLMFAAGDVPDIMLAFPIRTNDIVKYGVGEGQLMAFNDYLTEDYMPNVLAESESDPVFMALGTAPDGNIYAIPRILSGQGSNDNANIRISWLEALGLESPKTLDEFLDTMRAFKEADVDGHGSENIYPLGGSFAVSNPFATILNAMGYNMNYSWADARSSIGLTISVRDGEATYACNDDIYYDFLQIAKMCYDEKLISPNFFTMDSTQVNAMSVEGVFGYICIPMHTLLPEPKDFQNWYCMSPLTSQWNEEAQTPSASRYDLFSIFVSADTKYPEVCARFVDFYYGPEGIYMWYGPGAGTKEAEIVGTEGYIWADDSIQYEGVDSRYSYIVSTLMPGNFQHGIVDSRADEWAAHLIGLTDYKYVERPLDEYDMQAGGSWSGHGQRTMIFPYAEPGYPNVVYRSEDDVNMLADYSAVIEPYVQEQFSMFVTGKRALNEEEFTKYLAELKSMGMDEYEKFYQDEYNAYLQSIS